MNYARSAWYAAAWSAEVSSKPISRILLGDSVLLARKSDGQAVALGNRCPHRFAPLHLGRLSSDSIQCAYHGLRFNFSGACVANPTSQGAIPHHARIAAYPISERNGLIWIWMGEAKQSDLQLLADFSGLDDPTRRHARGGYLHVKANYQLLVDNLLDLSHIPFLHPQFGTGDMAQGKIEITEHGNVMRVDRFMHDVEAPEYLRHAAAPNGRIDHWLDMRLHMPSSMLLTAGASKPGQGRIGAGTTLACHIVTPETHNTSHYFFSISQEAGTCTEEEIAELHEAQKRIFSAEDVPMLEGCQLLMGTTDLWALNPVLLPTDVGPVRARKWLEQMIHNETVSHA